MKLISPVFTKELMQLAQSRRHVWMKGIFLVILVITLLAIIGNSYAASSIGPNIFNSVINANLLAIAIYTPIVTAGAVCGERESRTLGLLFITRLNMWNIVQDKGLSRVAFLFYICMLTFPFLAAAVMCGGVETAQVVNGIGNMIGLMLFSSGLGLICSTYSRRYLSALICTYAILLIHLMVLPLILGQIMEEALAWINPFVSANMAGSPYTLNAYPWIRKTWISNLLIGCVTYFGLLALASVGLRRIMNEDREENGRTLRSRISSVVRFFMMWNPGTWFAGGRLGNGNPVVWLHSGLHRDSTRRTLIHLSNIGCFIYLLCLLPMMDSRSGRYEEMIAISHGLAVILTVMFVCIVGAGSFTRQHENLTFDVLSSTALPGRAIARGTVLGNVRACLPVVYFPMLVIVTGKIFDRGRYGGDISFLVPMINLIVYMFYFLMVSMYISLRNRSSIRAISLTAGFVLLIGIGIPLLGALLQAEDLIAFSPALWLATGIMAHEIYDLDSGMLSWGGYIFVTGFIYLPSAVFAYWLITHRFNETIGRQNEENLRTLS